jgi:TolB protein
MLQNRLYTNLPSNEPDGARLTRRGALAAVSSVGGLALVGMPSFAQAQFRVDVAGVGLTQRPFAIAAFRGRELLTSRVDDIVTADLERSGLFRVVPMDSEQLDEASRPDLGPWRARGVDALVTGSVNALEGGRFDVRFRLWDVVRAEDLGGVSFPVEGNLGRLAAHRVADAVYEKLTGEKGVFSTRVAYVTKSATRHQLWVADADGENAQVALSSPEPVISPAWSPDGNQLAYVSFEARKPVIYAHTIATGKRRLMANFKGSNSAPAWSPDGQTMLATLTLSGNSQIYKLDKDGGAPQRLTRTSSIDTEPVFAPDGSAIYFVSNRGGSPQIYRMPASGGGATRVTFQGNYNISPAPSADGKWLAFVGRIDGLFRLQLLNLETNEVRGLTDTDADESPSFSANSRMIIYATRVAGREALMTVSVDGRVRTRLAGATGDIREPDWGPFRL